MKYLLLIYSNPANWAHPTFQHQPADVLADEDVDMLTAQFHALLEEIEGSGELVDSAPLADPMNTRTVQVRGGAPVTTDGPYVEAKEQLAGYFVVDCESPERAAEIAARFPDARFAAVEVRPIMDLSRPEL